MPENIHTKEKLKELQAMPLWAKIQTSQARMLEFNMKTDGQMVAMISGGKDSTVLAHLYRQLFPNGKMCFANTGLEYPEVREFAKALGADVVYPKMSFPEVLTTYGYPIISKEVSEAIYYARRIRSQSVNVERENKTTIRKRKDFGERTSEKDAYG